MSRWRRQLPAYSPLSAAAVAAGWLGSDRRSELREELRREYDAADVILTGSGTMALELALQVASAGRPGAACVLPAYGCFDLATAAVGAGVPVRLYDLDPLTLAPDAASLERALTGGAAALVVVHLYGIPVPMDAMHAAAARAGAVLIEDSAQGAGGRWQGRPLGAHGAMGILSFGRGKGLTGGGGGALIVKSPDLVPQAIERSRGADFTSSLPLAAKLTAQWLLGRPSLYRLPASLPGLRLGDTVYHPPAPLRDMSPASSRVVLRTLTFVATEVLRRRVHAGRLRTAAAGAPGLSPVAVPDPEQASWLRLPILTDAPAATVAERWSALGVQAGYPIALGKLRVLAGRIDGSPDMPGAARLAGHLVTLPTHSLLSGRDLSELEDRLARGLRA